MKHVTIVGGLRVYAHIVKRVMRRACKVVHCPRGAEVSVIFVSDAKMREINRVYRGKDKTTNVLAFPSQVPGSRFQVSDVDLGDIFISLSEAKREAKKYGWTASYSVARLAVHGFLHLLGYDHVKDREARKMERIESKILTSTKIGHE